MSQKEIKEIATQAASAEVEIALFNWKADQMIIRQQQLEEVLKKTILEHNVDLFRDTASALGLAFGKLATAPQSRPTPLTGNKRTASGSAPQHARAAKSTPLPSVPDVTPPQVTALDIVTLTAAVQTAIQPFMARMAAIESSTAARNKTSAGATNPQPIQVQAEERAHPIVMPPVPERTRQTPAQHALEGEWVQAANKRKRGEKGKPEQTNPPLQQVNLTPQSYAAAATTAAALNNQPTQNQPPRPVSPAPPAFTEVTVVRLGGSLISAKEQTFRGGLSLLFSGVCPYMMPSISFVRIVPACARTSNRHE